MEIFVRLMEAKIESYLNKTRSRVPPFSLLLLLPVLDLSIFLSSLLMEM